MKNDNIKMIGGGLFPVEIDIEIGGEIPSPSECDLDMIERNKEQIEYLKTTKN